MQIRFDITEFILIRILLKTVFLLNKLQTPEKHSTTHINGDRPNSRLCGYTSQDFSDDLHNI